MSVHKSLKSSDTHTRHRSVLTRSERIGVLEEEERWQEGDSVFGLSKVKVQKARKVKKVKKTEEEDAETAVAAEGETAEGAAAPADDQ